MLYQFTVFLPFNEAAQNEGTIQYHSEKNIIPSNGYLRMEFIEFIINFENYWLDSYRYRYRKVL